MKVHAKGKNTCNVLRMYFSTCAEHMKRNAVDNDCLFVILILIVICQLLVGKCGLLIEISNTGNNLLLMLKNMDW